MRHDDDRGSMPFALAAVAILLLSVVAGAVLTGYGSTRDGSDGSEDDLESFDMAVYESTAYVNSGLGGIVGAVSTDGTLGDMESRTSAFKERAEDWIEFQFPMASHGARISCTDHSVDLVAVSSDLSAADGTTDYLPAHVKGVGTLSIRIESQIGSADSTIEVYTDGSYSLPLAVERSELFGSMASGGGISISQMMSSQLNALAEYRVINGYGGLSAYGEKGTSEILTAADVEDAFKRSMEAVTAICFRSGSLTEESGIDLAGWMVSGEGLVSIDLSAVYAQALASSADDLVLRWMDYLYGFEIVESIRDILTPHKGAIESLKRFLAGERGTSGVPYLRDMMSSFGYAEEDYRFPGSGTSVITVGGLTVAVERPVVDLFSRPWLTSFKRTYESEKDSDYVRELLLGVVNAAAADIAERRDLGTVEVDVHGEGSFSDRLMEAYRSALGEGNSVLKDHLTSSLSSATVYDEFYGRIADEIRSHASDLTDEDGFRNGIRAALVAECERRSSDEGWVQPDVDGLMGSDEVSRAVSSYRASVRSDLEAFDGLRKVEGSDDGLVKKLLRAVCVFGMGLMDPVTDRSEGMLEEIAWNDGTNPYSGCLELPGTDRFVLNDGDGAYSECLSVDIDASSVSFGVRCEGGMHTVGFRENPYAAYKTTFIAEASGWLDYSVTGTGSLSGIMGTSSSSYIGGFPIGVSMEIPVSSGWALAGVDYEPSDTVLADAVSALMKLFEPIIEPLREMLEAIRSALAVLTEALAKVAGFVAENLMALYEAFIDPVERMNRMILDYVEEAVSDAVFDIMIGIGLGSQRIVMDLWGMTLELKTSAITYAANTKSVLSALLTIPIAGLTVTAGIDVKVKGDWDRSNLVITGNGGVSGDGWSVNAVVDPLMKGSKYLFTLNGKVGKNRLSLVAPKLEDYNEFGLTLSDVPGIGEALNSIPLPALGVNLGLDAGFQLRCKAPTQEGVVINEYESNPEGTDRGNEWVEICNNGTAPVELDGWTLALKAKGKNDAVSLEGTLAPGEFLVVDPPSVLVNSPSSDRLILRDEGGSTVDEVKLKKDTLNDGSTWQREYDGASRWVQKEGTKGSSNGSFLSTEINIEVLKDCAWKGVQKAFDRIGEITDLDSLAEFMKYLVRYTVEEIVSVLAGMIIDASVFVSADLKDASSSASTGIRIALRTDGDLVKDCLKYIAGKIGSLVLGMRNPYSIDPLEMFTENIDLEVLYHTGIGFPEALSDGADLPRLDLGFVVRANLASLSRIIGTDMGRPEIEFGILARDCPSLAIPHRLHPKSDMTHDLWIFKASVVLERC